MPTPFLWEKGHLLTRSKECLANPDRLIREGLVDECARVSETALTQAVPAPPFAGVVAASQPLPPFPFAETAGEPVIELDPEVEEQISAPFGYDSDDSSQQIFFDTNTWSDGEEEDGF